MIPCTFEYQTPETIADTLSALKAGDGDALLLAGGHSLIPMMKLRLAQPTTLIDLSRIDELRGIKTDGDTIVIGAMTTQHEIIESDDLAKTCPILGATAAHIADPQVRYKGTIGGNAANGDPGNDLPAVLMALDARYVLVSGDGEREVAAREYYQGVYFTVRKDDELLKEIRIPTPAAGHGYSYQKQKRKIGDYATAAVGVILNGSGGNVESASVALTNLADTPLLVEDAAKALVEDAGNAGIQRAAEACKAACSPSDDLRGTPEFRSYVAGVLADRAIREALQIAK